MNNFSNNSSVYAFYFSTSRTKKLYGFYIITTRDYCRIEQSNISVNQKDNNQNSSNNGSFIN